MADGRQPEEHWGSNGRENSENGYSYSAYRENGYHGEAAAHPGTAVDDSANLPPSPPPSPSAEQIGPGAAEERVEVVSVPSAEGQQEDEEEAPEELHSYQAEVTHEQPGDMLLEKADFVAEPQALACQQAQTTEVLNGGRHQAEQDSPLQKEERVEVVSVPSAEGQQEDEEEAPEELHSYPAEVTYEQPGDMLLEQADFVAEPQALACQQAQTTEVLNGGRHQAEQDSRSQEEDKALSDDFQVQQADNQDTGEEIEEAPESHLLAESKAIADKQPSLGEEDKEINSKLTTPKTESEKKMVTVERMHDKGQDIGGEITFHETASETDVPKVDQKPEMHTQSSKSGTESKIASDTFTKDESEVESYFETSAQSHGEEPVHTQSYYELSTVTQTTLSNEKIGDDLDVESSHHTPDQLSSEVTSESSMTQKLEEHPERAVRPIPGPMSLEQRTFSLNITVGSLGPVRSPQRQAAKSRAFSTSLCTIRGSIDESTAYAPTPPVDSRSPMLPPALSITPTKPSEDFPTKVERHGLPSTTHNSSLAQSSAISEMLDLAGAVPRPSLERREMDHMRRKSVPVNVSALVGTSLAKLALGEQTSGVVGGESQLEELGYCVFNEYSGPMPSPADLPSPGDSPHQCFPSMEGNDEDHHGTTEDVQQVEIEHQNEKENIPQKSIAEKKDVLGVPVKSTMMLERAVTSGVKPDRLRIPVTASKDRLNEFRLESGLPGDIKIQAIPEVEVERDPSREASPIPPDSSFTFTTIESGGEGVQSPTALESPPAASSEPQLTGDEAKNVVTLEVKAEKDSESESDKEMQKSDQEHHNVNIDVQEKGPTTPRISSPVVVIPQAQVEEEADEEDVELAEEPQEIMEETEEEARLVEDRMTEDEPKSGAVESSHSAQTGDEGEPARDSSYLSDNINSPRPPLEESSDEGMEEIAEEPQKAKEDEKKEEEPEGGKEKKTQEENAEVGSIEIGEEKGEEEGKQMEEEDGDVEIGQELEESADVLSQTANDETAMDISVLDTDSGWMDSQDDDKSVMTEQIEALPQTKSPTRTPVVDRPAKRGPGRGRGHSDATESKVSRKVPSHHHREEMKKKKVGTRRADQNKVSVLQSRSPSRKSLVKAAAARQPRPALLHGSARRKATVMDSRQPLSVAHQSRERTTERAYRSPEKRSSLPRPAKSLTRHIPAAEQEDNSTPRAHL
ncbi:uncharacterized protein ACN63O_019103 [Diretmus argenteus]